jgi:hypothetical protein
MAGKQPTIFDMVMQLALIVVLVIVIKALLEAL